MSITRGSVVTWKGSFYVVDETVLYATGAYVTLRPYFPGDQAPRFAKLSELTRFDPEG